MWIAIVLLGGALLVAFAIIGVVLATGPSLAQRAAARAGTADASFMVYVIEHDPSLPATMPARMPAELEKLGHLDCRALAEGASAGRLVARPGSVHADDVAVLHAAVRFYCPRYRSAVG